MKEQYKPIKDFPGYQVSDRGNVKNILCQKLKVSDNGTGYLYIGLWDRFEQTKCYIHRLVAQEFLPNPLRKTDVHHINHNRKDNKLTNLVWATRAENKQYSSKLSWPLIQIIREASEAGHTQKNIAHYFKVSRGHVGDIINRVCWA